MLRRTLSYALLQLCTDGPENGAGVKLDVYFAFETVRKGKEWGEEEGGETGGGGGGGGVLLLWNDINVQKWFHMQRLSARGLGRPGAGRAPRK